MKEQVQVNLRLPPQEIKRLDKYAAIMGLSRNQLMCNMISIGNDDLAVLNKLGLLRFGAGVRDLFLLARDQDDLNCIDPDCVMK